jgi:hypothetical protein
MEELMEDLFANISRECGDNLTCNLTKFACNGTWVDDQCLVRTTSGIWIHLYPLRKT